MKSEADCRQTFEKWRVAFIDKDRLAAAEFYFTNQSDMVRCAFCGVEIGSWQHGDDPFKDHALWSPSCGFTRSLSETSLLVLPTNLPHRLSSLLEAATSVVPISI